MLTAVDSPTSVLSDPILKRSENIFPNLELRFDKSAGILWKFLAPDSTWSCPVSVDGIALGFQAAC